MLHASTRKLIDRLSEMTELGKLDWAAGEDGTIAYATEGYSVSLTETPNEVIITSKDGKELERATAEELAATQQDDGTTYTAVVAAMTMEAARVARGTEAAISSLLAGMQDAPDEAAIESDDSELGSEADLQEDPVNESTAIVAEPAVPESEDAAPESDAEAEPITETDSSPEPVQETISETESEPSDRTDAFVAIPQQGSSITSEDTASAEESVETIVQEAAPEEDADASTDETESSETESDVTEAVARLANEVNQREDTGLDAAAASAAGAVALAAGLAIKPVSEEADSTDPIPESETPVDVDAAADASERPAYIPFGLESESETEPTPITTTEASIEDAPEIVETEMVADLSPEPAETEPQPEAPETIGTDPVSSDTATAPVETSWSVSAAEADSDTVAEAEPEPESEPVSAPVFVGAPSLNPAPASDFGQADDSVATAEEAPMDIAASAEPEAVDVVADTPEAEAPATEPVPPKTYSLSGIGAGFGLGALSARTEASGIPAPTAPRAAPQEKVIIDATDDVLPELEGNLNTSLAETASAAVSAANAESAPADPADPPAEAESDILKPRTRFNPWD